MNIQEVYDNMMALLKKKQSLIDKGIVKDRAAKALQIEIDILTECLFTLENERIYQVQKDLDRHEKILQLLDKIQCLEAIALLHGIDDINLWLAKGTAYCTDLALQFYFNQERDYSLNIGKLIEETRPARIIQIPAALCQK